MQQHTSLTYPTFSSTATRTITAPSSKMSSNIVRVKYGDEQQSVALYEGISPDELAALLRTIFKVDESQPIVGFSTVEGLVLPLSLVSRSPNSLSSSLPCKLLVGAAKGAGNANKEDDEREDEDDEEDEDENSSELVTREIVSFIAGLRARDFLTSQHAHLLTELLASNSTLLFAAYSVAVSANDSEYFAEICKDLAQSLMSEQGRIACEAQDEVLQVCDQLYLTNRISENQLLYLRHLVLIREEAVATIYDDFQEHQNVQQLARALYELCNTHPYQQRQQTDQNNLKLQDSDEDEDNEGNEAEEEQSPTTAAVMKAKLGQQRAGRLQGLTGVVSLMMRTHVLSSTEAPVLLDMVREENEYVLAAYELYEGDQNLEELQDTLLRCAKLEIRKRKLEQQEDELAQMRHDAAAKAAYNAAIAGADEEEDDEDDEDEECEDDASNDKDPMNFSLEDIGLQSILESVGMTHNLWQESVPQEFVKAVFIAVIRKQLAQHQAKALCDLYHANYDLVKAAWEVYTVQQDTTDFIDTLRRIVKDLSAVDDDGNGGSADSARAGEPPELLEKDEPSLARAMATAKANEKTLQDRKKEALAAVSAAKRDLLKHSLQMMVNQSILSEKAATELFSRYLQGDALVEAAIDAYAQDRDVSEFLDTLQVLGSRSPEELQQLISQVGDSPTASQDDSNVPKVEDSDTGSPPSVNSVQLQLRGIVNELSKNKMISDEALLALNKMIVAKDSRVFAAYSSYSKDRDGAVLIDTLLSLGSSEAEKRSEEKNAGTSAAETALSNGRGKSTATDTTDDNLLNQSDQQTVIDILSRANAISDDQGDHLRNLINEGNPKLLSVFRKYEADKDVYALIDSLREVELETKSADPTAGDTEDEGDDTYDEDDEESIEVKFLQIVQKMDLSHIETAALRLAIARDDNSIRTAIDAYRLDLDENSLMHALRRISQQTIANTMAEQEMEDDDEANNAEDGKVNEEDAADEDEDDDDEDDDEDDDDDDDEENDVSQLTSQAARNHVFPILINELVNEHILPKDQGERAVKMFRDGNPIINNALDDYDKDSDLGKLVTILQQTTGA